MFNSRKNKALWEDEGEKISVVEAYYEILLNETERKDTSEGFFRTPTK